MSKGALHSGIFQIYLCSYRLLFKIIYFIKLLNNNRTSVLNNEISYHVANISSRCWCAKCNMSFKREKDAMIKREIFSSKDY